MKNISYFNAQGPLSNKSTPQVNLLITALRAKFSNREFTLKEIEASVTPNEIGTRQNVTRIFAYYQEIMLESKLLVKNIIETYNEKSLSKKAAQKDLAISLCAKIDDEDVRDEIINAINNI